MPRRKKQTYDTKELRAELVNHITKDDVDKLIRLLNELCREADELLKQDKGDNEKENS